VVSCSPVPVKNFRRPSISFWGKVCYKISSSLRWMQRKGRKPREVGVDVSLISLNFYVLLALSSKLAVFLSCVSWIPFCVFCYVSHAVAAGTYPWLARISPSEAWSEDPITVGCSGVHRKFSWGGVLCNGTWWSFVFGRLSEENTLNATTQQFITAKISGCALKQ